MREIKPPEAILSALLLNAIDLVAAKKYYANYIYFEKQRARIESSMSGKWVAAVNGKLVTESSLERLDSALAKQRDGDRAYLKHIGSAV